MSKEMIRRKDVDIVLNTLIDLHTKFGNDKIVSVLNVAKNTIEGLK